MSSRPRLDPRAGPQPPTVTLVPRLAVLAPFTLILVGFWLLIAAWLLGYPFTEGAVDAHWQEILAGMALILLMTIRFRSPQWAPGAVQLAVLVGAWLAAAPFVLGYGELGTERIARLHDLTVGILVALLAAVTSLIRRFAGAQHRHGRSEARPSRGGLHR